MMKLILIQVALVISTTTNAQVENCGIPGNAMHWIADFCLHQAETDDFQEPRVQACFAKQQGYKIQDTCENRNHYKLKLCQHLVGKEYYQGDVDMCLHDKEFLPTTVRRGGI